MRVAVLNDIHGNLPALEAVLVEVRAARGERIVVGGDVLLGPMVREMFAALGEVGVPVDYLYGNGEIAVLDQLAGRTPRVPENYRPTLRWVAEQLGPEDERFLASWPLTVRLTIPPLGDVLFCHATPKNENDIFTAATPEERLLPIFESAGASVVVCGHTHMPFDRMVGRTRVVNPGSVGMPFGEPGADWLLLGPGVELRHTSYDLTKAADRIRATKYPQAEEFAAKYVLDPPSAEQMLAAYAKAAL